MLVPSVLLACALAAAPPATGSPAVDPRISRRLTAAVAADPRARSVVVELGSPADIDRLEAQGLHIEAVAHNLVQVRILPADLLGLVAIDGMIRARLPHRAHPKATGPRGDIHTEGLAPIFDVTDWHAAGIDGRGVDVAVVDIGFDGWADLAGTELPTDATASLTSPESGTAHGTAAAEVVADLAPGARLHLFQFETDVELLELMDLLPEMGIEVVTASIGFDNIWHADGTSPVSRGVDQLVSAGVVWVNAAGNERGRYVIGELTDEDGDGWAGLDGQSVVSIDASNGALSASLRWSEPMRGATWDLDLAAWPSRSAFDAGDPPCLYSDERQNGDGSPPLESIAGDCYDVGVDGVVAFQIVTQGDGDLANLDGYLYAARGITGGQPAVHQTLTLPADARLAVAVGACEVVDGTYVEGGEADQYSSQGPTDDGRSKPDLCAASAATTGSLGGGGFVGTSASAPHVAGLAALIVQAEGLSGAPEAVQARLVGRATDLGEPGVDLRYGAGGAQAGNPGAPCGCTAAPTRGAALAALAALFAAATRRKHLFVAASRPRG